MHKWDETKMQNEGLVTVYNFIQNYPWGDNGNYRSLSLYMWLRNNSLEQIAAKLFAGDSERAWQELQQANRIWKWAIHT